MDGKTNSNFTYEGCSSQSINNSKTYLLTDIGPDTCLV